MDFGLSSLDDFLGSGSNLDASRASSMAANNHKLFNFPSSPTPQASFPSKVYGFQSSPSAYDQASSGAGGPFTASQWMELEYQVLIFKYLSASVPVPPELLTALIKKPLCLYSYGSSGGFYRPDLLGRIGYRGSPVDSEPGRCRRTDGKKWRCSRDVVGDQKYCERHMNRGRYRNRKPVDGQTSVPATAQQTANSNGLPVVGSTSSALVISSSEPVNVTTQQQTKDSEVAAAVNVKSDEEAAFTVPKPIEEESSDSFISSSKKRKYVNSEDCDEPFPSFNKQDTEEQHPLRQFIEDSPEDQRNRSAISWAEELKSDWNQLSLSAPVQEKIALSMNMGVIGDFSEPNQKKSKWVSISPAGTSISDPLGEILITKNTGNAGGSCQSSSTAR